MKKMIVAALVLLAATGAFAQKAVITGKITGLKPTSQLVLMDLNNPQQPVPVSVTADGTYQVELDADEPLTRYLVVDDPKTGFKFYAEKGMKANIDVNIVRQEEGGEEYFIPEVTYTGDNKDAFDFLTEGEYFQNVQNPVLMTYYGKSEPTFGEFRQQLRYRTDLVEGKLKKVSSPTFRQWMKNDYETKMNNSLVWFTELSSKADSTYLAFMETLDRDAVLNDAQQYVAGYKKYCLPEGQDPHVAYLNALPTIISNKEFVNQIADQEVENVIKQAPANIADVFAAYKAIDPTRGIPEEIQTLYNHYKDLVPGAKAADFDFYDMNGKKLTLSKLKGKALYIDCWATWCGPCRAETPNMVKLYEHFKGDKRIQLVSISLDKKEAAWKAVVKKEQLPWAQYIVKGEFESALCQNYDINGIPRFMMFDKDGRIISLNAPRPSDENIVEWIETNLK